MNRIAYQSSNIVAALCKLHAPSSKTKAPVAASTWRRHLARSLFITCLLTLPAQAQLDTNTNGMSDIWERHFNNGELFDPENPDHHPSADPDGDGWTNLIESFAGTDPFDNKPPEGIVPAYVVHLKDQEEAPSPEYPGGRLIDLAIISWDTIPGKKYTLTQSADLSANSWVAADVPHYGEGDPIADTVTLNQTGGISPEKFFWRVAIEDTDSDDDGLTDHEEFLLGLNPFNAETSSGLPDMWIGTNFPNTASSFDPNHSPHGNGLTYMQMHALGMDPNEEVIIGPVNLGMHEEITDFPDLSFRDENPSDLYHKDSIIGWQPVIGDYLEIWDEDDGYPYIELQAHLQAHGARQTFNMLPGATLKFFLRYKGRYDWCAPYDNEFKLEINGAQHMWVDGNETNPANGVHRHVFMNDDSLENYMEWHTVFVVITTDPAATSLVPVTLSLIPANTEPSQGAEMTRGGFVQLLPLELSVFPPEPTESEIQAAGDDNWEVETFQIAADDNEFWIQANVFVAGINDDGEPAMIPAGDGSVITWEIDGDVSDEGATLSAATSETEDGHTAIRLTTSTLPGNRFKVRGKLTTFIKPTHDTEETTVIESSEGFGEVVTQFFEVVPGNVATITLTSASPSMPADEASELVLLAEMKDSVGNPAARGTDVNWRVSGGGKITDQQFLIHGQDGLATATLVAGSLAAKQIVTVEADGTIAQMVIENTPVEVTSLIPTANTIDIATGQTTVITLQTSNVADGAPVTWATSKGVILNADSTIQNNTAVATLSTGETTIGTAMVFATVGDAIANCEVDFESSAAISIGISQAIIVHDEASDGTAQVPSLYGDDVEIPYFAETEIRIRAPDHPNAWATVSMSGSSGNRTYHHSFDLAQANQSPARDAGQHALLTGDAAIWSEHPQIRLGEGSLHLPDALSTAVIDAHGSLNLQHGSSITFSIMPDETSCIVFEKSGEYQAAFAQDGRLEFTVETSPVPSTVTSAKPILDGMWSDVTISIHSGQLWMRVSGLNTSIPLQGALSATTSDFVIGGTPGYFDELQITHPAEHLQGINLVTVGLNGQNQVQLDANGEAVVPVKAQVIGDGPPETLIGQNVDIEVTVDNETSIAQEAFTVTGKGTAILIRAIAGSATSIGTDTTNLNRAEMAQSYLRSGVRAAERAGVLPDDLGADAAARGECGYLIAIWMEETVDEAGNIHPLMHVSAQNLPEEVAEVLNWMLAELMVSAGHRHESESFHDYIHRNYKELLEALKVLSAGDIGQFLTLAGVLDGEEGFQSGAAVAEQVGSGVVMAFAKDAVTGIGNAYDNLGALIRRQNWGVVLRERGEVTQMARNLQKDIIQQVTANATNAKEAIILSTEYLLSQHIIDPEEAAALGFAYGIIEAADQLGQDVAQPELIAQCLAQLADLSISAVGGDEQAREALKEIGSMAVMMPISAVEGTQAEWNQGNYFQAGANSVAVVQVALVTKYLTDLAVKTTRKAIPWGRLRSTDWLASSATVGRRAESLAFSRLRAKGFKDIFPIQNSSNHGIDWVCRDSNGGILFIEVKGHRFFSSPRLSRRQKDMRVFTEDVLSQAVARDGRWANISNEIHKNATNLLKDIQVNGTSFKGVIINVDWAVSKRPRSRYHEWLNGVGPIINPQP